MKRNILIILIGACVALLHQIPGASAEPLYNKPVYDPASKSYIEMARVGQGKYAYQGTIEMTWDAAEKAAAQSSYNGAKGRLVVVKSLATHEFLERTFQPDTYIWMGLRWSCMDHSLQFTDGSRWQNGSFQVWDTPWDQSAVADPCYMWKDFRRPTWMPIAYLPLARGFRWMATGEAKKYYGYFVEYPTGAP
jgi:hypothetical protein